MRQLQENVKGRLVVNIAQQKEEASRSACLSTNYYLLALWPRLTCDDAADTIRQDRAALSLPAQEPGESPGHQGPH